MDKKTFARTSQAVTVRCKQMAESGQHFCASILPELDGDYVATKKCESILNSSRTGHIAKMLVSTKFKKISEDEAKDEPTEAYIPDPLVVVTYVPEILQEKLSAQDWHNAITKDLIPIETEAQGAFVYGIYRHPEPFKGQDELVCNSFAFLKTRKLYIEPPESEDDDELMEFRNQLV